MWKKNSGLMQSRLLVMKERMDARAVEDSTSRKEGALSTRGVLPSEAGAPTGALSTRELEFALAVSRKLSEDMGYNPAAHTLLECPLPPPVQGPDHNEPREAIQMAQSSFTSVLMALFAVALAALLGGQIWHR